MLPDSTENNATVSRVGRSASSAKNAIVSSTHGTILDPARTLKAVESH